MTFKEKGKWFMSLNKLKPRDKTQEVNRKDNLHLKLKNKWRGWMDKQNVPYTYNVYICNVNNNLALKSKEILLYGWTLRTYTKPVTKR